MLKITIIGSGNVAQHLITAFQNAHDVEIIQVFARNPNAVSAIIDKEKITSDFAQLQKADIFIIAVSDNAIEEVSGKIPFGNKLVIHTSGSVAMTALNDKNRKGVLYPLQTFSKTKPIDFNEIPICLEAENNDDFELLKTLAQKISDVVYAVNSEQRKALHVSAVFVSNFVNHLYYLGQKICEENQLDFDILKPLIKETADKIILLSPNEAQTGPAKRNDTITINSHLDFLNNENQKEIYKLLTKSIIDNGKKL